MTKPKSTPIAPKGKAAPPAVVGDLEEYHRMRSRFYQADALFCVLAGHVDNTTCPALRGIVELLSVRGEELDESGQRRPIYGAEAAALLDLVAADLQQESWRLRDMQKECEEDGQ